MKVSGSPVNAHYGAPTLGGARNNRVRDRTSLPPAMGQPLALVRWVGSVPTVSLSLHESQQASKSLLTSPDFSDNSSAFSDLGHQAAMPFISRQ